MRSRFAEVFEVKLSVGSLGKLRQKVSAAVAEPVRQAQAYVQQQASIGMDETSFPQGNVDAGNPTGQQGWLWVMVTPWVCYFQVLLSRSQAAAQQVLGSEFKGNLNSDR